MTITKEQAIAELARRKEANTITKEQAQAELARRQQASKPT